MQQGFQLQVLIINAFKFINLFLPSLNSFSREYYSNSVRVASAAHWHLLSLMVSLDTEVKKLLKRNIRVGKKIRYKYVAARKEMFVEFSGDMLLAIINS